MSSANPDRDVIAVMEAQAIAYEKSAKTLRAAIAVMRTGALAPKRTYSKRNGPAGSMVRATLDFFEAHPGERFRARDVLDGIEKGFSSEGKDPLNQLRNVLSQLAQQGKIRRAEKGVYEALATGPDATVTHLLREGGVST